MNWSHVSVLILPIGFSMVANDPIGVCCRSSLSIGCRNFSLQSVEETLEQTIAKIHVSNRIDTFWELHTSRHLSVSVCPLMLDTFHMPLIDNDNYFFLWTLINSLEQVWVSLVNKNLLKSWEEDVHVLNVPVHEIWVGALLGELSCLWVLKSRNEVRLLCMPSMRSPVLKVL